MRTSCFALASIAIACLLWAAHPARAADCPTSCLMWSPYGGQYSGWVTQSCTPAAVMDTSISTGECFRHSKFDAAHGTIEHTTVAGFAGCYYGVTLDDDFRVEGPADGTQLPLVFHLDVHSTVSGWNGGDAHVSVSSPAAGTETYTFAPDPPTPPDPHVSENTSLTLEITAIVGIPFRISIWIDAGAFGESGSTVQANYYFDGVAQGAAVLSCRGFVQGEVPAVPATWSRVKATYR